MTLRILSIAEKIERCERAIRKERRNIDKRLGDLELFALLCEAAEDYRAQLPEGRPALLIRLEDRLMGVKLGDFNAAQALADEVAVYWPMIRDALAQKVTVS